ncbi:ferredoxin reductase [Hymenobacter crusticola]|uniref:Oxidoreductase n=1 Tax=Hymenobacter crusticola TaxID=1770526 RepID=A0A243WAZ8_9BACT|nr:ferredoxin reductase [Hymenobacter crusticola]OUJ72743.1 oxidoreductase [Hymenobacter crusticola]
MPWQLGVVTAIVQETPTVKTFTLQLPHWQPHLPGQHYDLRLTAEDGYQAERSYSIASPPEQINEIDLTIELVDDGEVSAYLHEGIVVGDSLEVRGPIGGYFVWRQEMYTLPLLLVAGGSGIVPLMAMLRHRALVGATNPTALLFSVRTDTEAIYRHELEKLAQQDPNFTLIFTFTRQAPPAWTGYQRRIDHGMLAEIVESFPVSPQVFICGPTQLVEFTANTLVDLGLPADTIRTERFGPTGIS